MNEREEFEGWTRKFYSDLACASDTWSDEKGTYTDYTHHMAWHLWQELQSRLEDLEQEMQEQCRIIGAGTERELRMAAKMEELEKENASLKQDAVRYRWLRDQKGLRLESDNMVWTRLDGSKYTSTHYLAANGTCHASLESLDLTVDTAMQEDKEIYA